MPIFAARPGKQTRALQLLKPAALEAWLKEQDPETVQWVKDNGFKAESGSWLMLPTDHGPLVLAGWEGGVFDLAELPMQLPEGSYQLWTPCSPAEETRFALGWALGAYQFDRYHEPERGPAKLVWPKGCDQVEVQRLVDAIFLARDLINTPASDLGPEELATEARRLAKLHQGRVKLVRGEALAQSFPAVHAVGRASTRAPLLIDLSWGPADAPKLTLVGKGVVFDSGGLDLKPAEGMLLMKKDMGGAAIALGLAQAVMSAQLPVRLRVLIAAVENAVSGDAFRPLDVITTRAGKTVEVGNTDAEGRLILADALCAADEEEPDWLIDFATLTGAARVALGTEVPALFTPDDQMAAELAAASELSGELIWRLPLVQAYRKHLKSRVADLNNVSNSRFGGAITAALFLQTFVPNTACWAHLDVMAYNKEAQPGRPAGGEAMSLRAVYAAIVARYGKLDCGIGVASWLAV